jgi:uncharacterized membrane protein YgcG
MRRRTRRLHLRLTYAIVFLFFCLPRTSYARSWQISDFHDTMTVAHDGSLAVSERITVQFEGEFHGIFRDIPIEYPGPHGTNFTLFLKITGITDDIGNKLRYESHTSNGYRHLKIYVPNAVDASRIVQIDYIVRNAVRYFDNYDEFYWNVTGNDWPVPIDHASAFVRFPENAAGSLRAQAFTGTYGSTQHEASAEVNGAVTSFETTSPLPMRGGLTVDVYIPKGILAEPSAFTRLGWFIGSNPVIFLPLWTFAVMFAMWWYKGRDPDPGQSVAPMYEPPRGISPAEAGTLIDDTVNPRDITSTIIDLAVRGFIKIEEVNEPGILFHHKDYVLHLLIDRSKWTGLAPHERVMLENIFVGDVPSTRLSSLKNHFYIALPAIRQDIMASLRQKGMYLLDPESANAYSFVAIIVIVGLFAALQFFGIADFFNSIGLLVISVLVSALIWWLFARQMTAKTMNGARTRIAILGFQEFIRRVDADRLKRMPPDTFEKYLPFAMALGIEQIWAHKFAGLIQNPPSWYMSPAPYPVGGFNPIFFTNSMHLMSNDMHQVFVSAPRASSTGSGWSGGGFSGGGGGFSGGGFGGGGGGAF